MWKIESARERPERILFYWSESNIERLQLHIYINNLFNVYVIQVKSREEKSYLIQSYFIFSSCTSLFHHIFLCSINDNHWAKERSFQHYNHEHHKCNKINFTIEDWRLKHRCIKYHQWRAEQRWCIIIKQHRHSHQEFA